MSLKNDLASDFANEFLSTDEFAESITYTPSGGSPKTIKAIVVRPQIDVLDQDRGRVLARQVEIQIANNSTTGVASVKKGFDQVALKLYLGDAANTTFVVSEIVKHDDGMWHLRLTK